MMKIFWVMEKQEIMINTTHQKQSKMINGNYQNSVFFYSTLEILNWILDILHFFIL